MRSRPAVEDTDASLSAVRAPPSGRDADTAASVHPPPTRVVRRRTPVIGSNRRQPDPLQREVDEPGPPRLSPAGSRREAAVVSGRRRRVSGPAGPGRSGDEEPPARTGVGRPPERVVRGAAVRPPRRGTSTSTSVRASRRMSPPRCDLPPLRRSRPPGSRDLVAGAVRIQVVDLSRLVSAVPSTRDAQRGATSAPSSAGRSAGRRRPSRPSSELHWPRPSAPPRVVGDAAAAEDIAQEAFLAAVGALDRFDRRDRSAPGCTGSR